MGKIFHDGSKARDYSEKRAGRIVIYVGNGHYVVTTASSYLVGLAGNIKKKPRRRK